jgi:hypothetical protein
MTSLPSTQTSTPTADTEEEARPHGKRNLVLFVGSTGALLILTIVTSSRRRRTLSRRRRFLSRRRRTLL